MQQVGLSLGIMYLQWTKFNKKNPKTRKKQEKINSRVGLLTFRISKTSSYFTWLRLRVAILGIIKSGIETASFGSFKSRRVWTPVSTKIVPIPWERPKMMSVFKLSPTIQIRLEGTSGQLLWTKIRVMRFHRNEMEGHHLIFSSVWARMTIQIDKPQSYNHLVLFYSDEVGMK